ncbi:glycosyltransferase family 2 protein [Pullulanibacillus sp. KACC 23026]|uniref:glycosyltransferase family 2 protein n=1 Tax=Pullulanibacillus sp. KACC 23026 TaxID=3028315 RepID=UPI0023B0091F|nr:glycosyltransferase family 2 protein [Pullulanibacillus sp. KACC 23026]WEG13390.1 glycosyltransferase family 2 protein [Pullulanibacillus sp. KACC 23026]
MDKKVSVIIPNFNAADFISDCINSVLKQTYSNIEIIVVDDGSTDNSWNIILDFKVKHKNILVTRQVNSNASIARNRGIDMANGDYILFLDSDDILYKSAIEILVHKIKTTDSDLILGNFVLTDSKGEVIHNYSISRDYKYSGDKFDYLGCVPNPSNKLFKLEIIKNHSIYFGNVRIGQDLNFFLKYMLFCKKIQTVNANIYMWRMLESSVSNLKSFRILDITESFRNVEMFYKLNNASSLYDKYIKIIEYRHYYLQMEKQKKFSNKKARKVIVNFFELHLNNLSVDKCHNFSIYKKDYIKCKMKLKFKTFYISRIYYWLDKKFARR